MEENNRVSQQNGLNNEMSLLNSYTESLQNVLKIEEELLSLRKKSTNKINLLNNQINVYSLKKKTEHEATDVDIKIIKSRSQNGISYNSLPTNNVKINNAKSKLDVYATEEFEYDKAKIAYSSDSDSVCLMNGNQTNSSLCVSRFYSQLNDDTNSNSSLNSSVLMDTNETQLSNDMENVSNFSKKLNNLYAHLIKQYIRDEKLLSKYFEVMYNVREKAALSMAKNELMRLKMQKSHVNEQPSSFRKKQRALLMKLHQEYNEIIFMKNFQKKLSDDRKKILLRQLKHFRTMFANGTERKTFYLKKSCISHKGKGEKTPVKCYNMPLKDMAHNNYSYLNCPKDKLDDLLHLHLDLQVSKSQLESVDKHIVNLDSATRLKDPFETSIWEIQKKDNIVHDLISLEDTNEIIDSSSLDVILNNKMNHRLPVVTFESSILKSLPTQEKPTNDTASGPLREFKIELETTIPICKHSKERLPSIDLSEKNSNQPTSVLSISTFNFNYTLHRAIDELLQIQNNNFATANRMAKLLFSAFENANTNCNTRVKFQNLLEKLFLLQNAIRNDETNINRFVAKDNIVCLLRSMFELLFLNRNAKVNKFELHSNEADCKVETILNVNLTTLLENWNHNEKFVFNVLKSNYYKIHKRYKNIKFMSLAPNTKFLNNSSKSNGINACDIIQNNLTDSHIDKIKCLKNLSIQKTDMKIVSFENENSHKIMQLVSPKENCEIKMHQTLKDSMSNVAIDDHLAVNLGHNSKAANVSKPYPNEEAEELRRKQLAVEMEIKALLEQQTTQIPYFVVREIPDKPPPPYIPPSEDKISTGTSTDLFIDEEPLKTGQLSEIIKLCFENIWLPFLAQEYVDDADAISNFKHQCDLYNEKSLPVNNLFLFDLCNELFCSEFRDRNKIVNAWDYRGYLSTVKKIDICKTVENLANQCLRYDTIIPKDNKFINCAHKLQDFVDELLIKELQDEEPEWVNVEKFEVTIKKSVTDYLLNAMITDTINEYKMLCENK